MDRWIVVHWFELTTMGLLCLNLWFVFEVLKVLRAVKDALLLLAGWLDNRHTAPQQDRDTKISNGSPGRGSTDARS